MISASKVLFIGAGASYGARERQGLDAAPPLGKDLLSYILWSVDRCIKEPQFVRYSGQLIFKREDLIKLFGLFAFGQRCNLNYEDLISKILKDNRDDCQEILNLINRFLAFSFCCGDKKGGLPVKAFEARADQYDDMIAKLNIDNTWIVISLNYDTLFEEALLRKNNRTIFYYGTSLGAYHQEDGAIGILKPHGSINFFGSVDQPSHGIQDVDYSKLSRLVFSDKYNVYTEESVDFYAPRIGQTLYDLSANEIYPPIMAHFARGKYTFNGLLKLEAIRNRCLEVIREAEEVTIIGVSLTSNEDDETVAKIFELCKKNKIPTTYVKEREDKNLEKKFPDFRFRYGMFKWLEDLSIESIES